MRSLPCQCCPVNFSFLFSSITIICCVYGFWAVMLLCFCFFFVFIFCLLGFVEQCVHILRVAICCVLYLLHQCVDVVCSYQAHFVLYEV